MILDASGDDSGSLETEFSKILGSFTETSGNNTTPQEKQHTSGERSERSERSDSGVRTHILQDFWGDSRKPPKRTRHHRKNVNNKTRFPFPYLDRFMLGVFSEPRWPKTVHDGPKRPKTPQDGPKTPQEAAKTRPRRTKMPPEPPRTAKMTPKWSQFGIKIP